MRKNHTLMSCVALILAALVLLGAYNVLNGVRVARQEEELLNKMQTILPGSTTFTKEEYTGEDANIREVYKGETGYVIKTVTYGYAGNITMLIGVSNEGSVTGLQVRDMQETHGLGGEALWDWEFLAQFLNTTGNVTVGTPGQTDAFSSATGSDTVAEGEEEYVDAITGATVTSKAIARSVNSAVGFVTGADTSSEATSWGG
jgi:electron transport complex protein RnfG